jgi:hypothetical protein
LACQSGEKRQFSVKSAYHVHAVSANDSRQAGSSEGVCGSRWRPACGGGYGKFSDRFQKNTSALPSSKVHHFFSSSGGRASLPEVFCLQSFVGRQCFLMKKLWRLVLPDDIRVRLVQCNSRLEFMHKGLNFPYENRTKLVCWWREWHKSNRGENDRQGRNSVSPFAGTLLNPEWAEFRRRNPELKDGNQQRWTGYTWMALWEACGTFHPDTGFR